ncbi:hypothetical protein [Scytonema sp. UIC 10036]|uniref:hypothetical protein n=1 Tax=Scytonema sp. UIC 10036 TaxID=2304196 RepID=UPI00140F81BC|nr:hypothetical protein [Scytonema sp. UIC 10036]
MQRAVFFDIDVLLSSPYVERGLKHHHNQVPPWLLVGISLHVENKDVKEVTEKMRGMLEQFSQRACSLLLS